MSRPIRFVLPAALALTTVLVSAGCSDSETESVARCDDVPEGDCIECVEDDGTQSCAGTPGCFFDSSRGACDEAVA